MKLSVVSTLYRSEPYIVEFYQRVTRAVKLITDDYELVLVNDGSPDRSLSVAKGLADIDGKLRVVDLSRNYGHHKALMTGLICAQGDFVFLIDSDLEEPPELFSEFWKQMHRSSDVDVVYGVQKLRKGAWFERNVAGLFYSLFNALSDTAIPGNVVNMRLMKRTYVQNVVRFQESSLVFSAVCSLAGYNQQPLEITKGHKGVTSYNFVRKIGLLVNSVTSFSAQPLIWIFYTGSLILAASLLVMLYLVYNKVMGMRLEGWTSLAASVWFLGGLLMFSVGICGIYLAKIYEQVKNRPFTIVREEYSGSDDAHQTRLTERESTQPAGRR